MKFEELLSLPSDPPWFDLVTLAQMTGENKGALTHQLSRWSREGKVLPLRRGVYALADAYRKQRVQPAALANALYTPSYLSGLWALGFYGLIPEMVISFTSVSTRVTRQFENAFGNFHYSNMKQSAFFGYEARMIDGVSVLIAAPEKALLDHWHLTPGVWTSERLDAMRYQNYELVDKVKLRTAAARFESPDSSSRRRHSSHCVKLKWKGLSHYERRSLAVGFKYCRSSAKAESIARVHSSIRFAFVARK
ncbi:MAG: hypothetical protein SFY80_11105 [Verrucomicrobiota bacterium]|nr:hypothetical protein [Verrucomicrobiota bacterium]